jgi:hypothetical protein
MSGLPVLPAWGWARRSLITAPKKKVSVVELSLLRVNTEECATKSQMPEMLPLLCVKILKLWLRETFALLTWTCARSTTSCLHYSRGTPSYQSQDSPPAQQQALEGAQVNKQTILFTAQTHKGQSLRRGNDHSTPQPHVDIH